MKCFFNYIKNNIIDYKSSNISFEVKRLVISAVPEALLTLKCMSCTLMQLWLTG